MVELESITHEYDPGLGKSKIKVLDNVTFSIPEGKITGFLGVNGAGKTTCIKILLKLIMPSKGTVSYTGILADNQLNINSYIGYMPERAYYYPYLTGEEFIFYMGELSKLKRLEIKAKMEYWRDRVNLSSDSLKRQIRTYSKGMLQRLGLLVTVLHDPLLIILDEPASGLDPIGRRDIKHLLLEFKNARKTILFTSHIISDIESIADRVIVLKDKKIIESGDISKILNHECNGRSFISGIDRNSASIQKEIATELVQVEIEKMIKENIKIISVVPIQKSLEEILFSTKGD